MGCSQNRVFSANYQALQNNNDINNGIQPGPCDPVHECPPPTEIVCIKVEKVFDSCQKAVMNTEITDLSGIAVGEILDAKCKFVELVVDDEHPFICTKINGTNRARVSFYFRYSFKYEDQENVKTYVSEPILHKETVIMDEIIQDPRIFVQCEVFLDCVECFPSNAQEVTCCIGKWIIFKLASLVQLMVPAYGYCPEPDFCPQVEAECPEFEPVWPPYPPQPEWPVNGNS